MLSVRGRPCGRPEAQGLACLHRIRLPQGSSGLQPTQSFGDGGKAGSSVQAGTSTV